MNENDYSIPTRGGKPRVAKVYRCPKCGNKFTSKSKRDKHESDGSCRKHKKGRVDWDKVPEVVHPDEISIFRQKAWESLD